MSDEITTTAKIADAIFHLTYGEIMDLAGRLMDMQADIPRNLESREGWADLLYSWAEGYDPREDE